MPPNDAEWHLDKRVPIALIVTLLFQTGAALWWAASMNSRVHVLENKLETMTDQRDRIIRLEEGMRFQTEILKRIESRLEQQQRRG